MSRLIDADELFNWGDKKLKDAVKYGNKSSEQQDWSYSTLMMYEIADEVNDAPTVDAVPVERKPVLGYDGYYEVDQFGRVYGISRVIHVKDSKREYDKNLSEKQMKQSLHTQGYKTVSLTKDGVTKTVFVHRLVAEAFIPNPDELPIVNHKDEDKTNNFVENLEWCTSEYNRTYGTAIERHARKIRGRPSEKRKSVVQLNIDGSFKHKYSSITDAANALSGAISAISAVCKAKRKSAYGYLWMYEADFCSRVSGERKRNDRLCK